MWEKMLRFSFIISSSKEEKKFTMNARLERSLKPLKKMREEAVKEYIAIFANRRMLKHLRNDLI